ncbi:MAG: AAA family ATPase, partial [Lachnospiraceae bacterium]|nr:AAA family ATPase [Lachnospiraceae bacterium]
MLLNLHVKNLAIIDEAEVDFSKNLNVLTGETGAGKSIIIGSISTALGGKVSKDMIRSGAEYALTELTFLIEEEAQKEKLKELGVSFEGDDTLLISRKIMEKRTQNRVNGETVTVSQIKAMADLLLDIHGQNEQQSLLHKRKHLLILDEYAGDRLTNFLEELRKVYHRYCEVEEELSEKEM